MVAEVKIDIDTNEVKAFIKNISKKQKAVITKSLNRVSNMAILMITKRTQAGKLPDGGKMRGYAKGTVKSRKKRGRQTGFVDLTDRVGGLKSNLFFSNMERAKIASFHDTFGVGKSKIKRPFFAIGDKEEDKIINEFRNFYFKEMGL